MKEDLSYEEALDDLQKILAGLQNEQISIDELASQSKKANTLIQYCRAKLKGIEDVITQENQNDDS